MQQTNETNKTERQKKFFLVLPLLIIPFCTLLFWALGGGTSATAQDTAKKSGLNIQLPKAQLKDDSADNKLSFYAQAEKDSLKLKQAIKDDPYYKQDTSKAINSDYPSSLNGKLYTSGMNYSGPDNNSSMSLKNNEAAIQSRLAAINKQINQPANLQLPNDNADSQQKQLNELQLKLSHQTQDDPEMKQLSGMLDKVIELEHPDIVRQQMKERSEKERGIVFPVNNMPLKQDETYLQSSTDVTSLNTQDPFNGHEGFLSNTEPKSDAQSNAITAMVHGTQTLTSGSTIKLRLLQDIYINGTLIPRNNFVFGNCNLEGDRLNIDIKTIRSERSVFPVSMKAFDMDGLAGIYVPGAISRDAAKEGADQAIQGLDFYSMSPSVGAQAASAGVQAVKGLFSKKVKLIKVTIKSGYSILLGNANLLNQ